MPINRLLAKTSLEPQDVLRLNEAYEHALRVLHLVDRDDPLTEIKKIIEVGKAGISDPAEISERAIKQLGLP